MFDGRPLFVQIFEQCATKVMTSAFKAPILSYDCTFNVLSNVDGSRRLEFTQTPNLTMNDQFGFSKKELEFRIYDQRINKSNVFSVNFIPCIDFRSFCVDQTRTDR